MALIVLGLGLISLLPRVEDPWPDSIGLGFPFAMAGAGGILAAVMYGESSPQRRDRAVHSGGIWGFRLGALFYFASLLLQVSSA